MNKNGANYRLSFVRANKMLEPCFNDIYCERVRPALDDLQDTLLHGYRQVDYANIGTSDNPCQRYIFEKSREQSIYVYVYPA